MGGKSKPRDHEESRSSPLSLTNKVLCKNTECGERIPAHCRNCPVCGEDAGFPNVRAAESIEEKTALAARFNDAMAAASRDGSKNRLQDFRHAAGKSQAVLCRPVGKVHELAQSDNELYASFYQLVEAWCRIPEDNEWDRVRSAVDALLFPYYQREIKFAALSLNETGITGYGGLTMVLQEKAIKARATVFEQNTIEFCRNKKVSIVGPVPAGYRAVWAERGDLAAAKLHRRITAATKNEAFPDILMSPSGHTAADFVEVHIYGPIHRRAIAKVTGKEPKRREDRILLRSIKSRFNEINVPVETVP